MEENIKISLLQCSFCQTTIETENVFCINCGFPQNGTEKDKAVFHAKNVMEKNKNMDADKKIKSARNILYVIAGLSFVFGIILYYSSNEISILLANGILSIIYIILGSWSIKKPLMALLLGLFLYLTTIIISAVIEPTNLIRGILWKIIIIAYLGKGIYSASSLKNEPLLKEEKSSGD